MYDFKTRTSRVRPKISRRLRLRFPRNVQAPLNDCHGSHPNLQSAALRSIVRAQNTARGVVQNYWKRFSVQGTFEQWSLSIVLE